MRTPSLEMTSDPASRPRRWLGRARTGLASVRLRLVGWFIVVLAIATIASVLVVRQILLQRLDARIDAELVQEIREVERLVGGNDPETGLPFGDDVDRIFEVALLRNVPARYETILTFVDGELAGQSSGDAGPRLEDLPSEGWRDTEQTLRGRFSTDVGQEVEYLAVPFVVDGSPSGVFVIAVDRDLQSEDTDAAALAAAAVGLAMLVIGSLLAVRMADRILAPVRAVSRTAQSISESDLSGRIDVQGYDEISELAGTFNDMLDRLDAAFATQRRFIDDAGHELRTPITVIQGHLDTLGEDPEERARTLALLDDELARVRRMIDDLITLARADRPDFVKLGPVDLGDLTRTLLDKARGLGARDWRLDAVADEPIWADEQRLTQAVLQLVENAVRHTTRHDLVAIGSAVSGGEVHLSVRDSGPGVPAEDQAKVFERFVRGRSGRQRAEGSGLGLSIVSAIAQAHGGRVQLETPPGGGATFTIIIPLRRGHGP
jgi:two-component system OmpR family sensor kinase